MVIGLTERVQGPSQGALRGLEHPLLSSASVGGVQCVRMPEPPTDYLAVLKILIKCNNVNLTLFCELGCPQNIRQSWL